MSAFPRVHFWWCWCFVSATMIRVGESSVSHSQRELIRDEILEMHAHAYKSYMRHAYPYDELMPLTCQARRWDRRERGTLDDVLGGYMMTMVDGADTLAVMGLHKEFEDALQAISKRLTFDRDVTVSTFEATIRVLGGLLSLHALVTQPQLPYDSPKMAEEMLRLAKDLGERLLPAFETPTGIPAHRVNLRRGVESNESRENCVASAGTMLLEFGRLSRLTGDARFENASRRAVLALWSRRSFRRNLVGASIDTHSGRWIDQHTGVGAGVDSFYEYLCKAAVYFDDRELAQAADAALIAAVTETRYMSRDGLEWNAVVHKDTGKLVSSKISALQAFWPSLLVFVGEVDAARKCFASFWTNWRKFRALPELYDVDRETLIHYARDSPLRPELVESAFHLYLATRDTHYLVVGREIVHSLQNISRVPCGFASVADVATRRLDDRMDSYFFSETLKYLFLLMDFSLEPAQRKSFFCAQPHECAQYLEPRNPPRDNTTSHAENYGRRERDARECPSSYPEEKATPAPLPAACDATRCVPPEHVLLSTEGHFFDLRHRTIDQGKHSFGPFASSPDR